MLVLRFRGLTFHSKSISFMHDSMSKVSFNGLCVNGSAYCKSFSIQNMCQLSEN